MRQSWFGIGSCLSFLSALVLTFIAWLISDAMKPSRPSHMDMSGVAILFVGVISAVLIGLTQLIGVVLGIIGLRQTVTARSAAQVGTVVNGVGLLCTIVVALVLLLRFSH
jgi:hypothetical protein